VVRCGFHTHRVYRRSEISYTHNYSGRKREGEGEVIGRLLGGAKVGWGLRRGLGSPLFLSLAVIGFGVLRRVGRGVIKVWVSCVIFSFLNYSAL